MRFTATIVGASASILATQAFALPTAEPAGEIEARAGLLPDLFTSLSNQGALLKTATDTATSSIDGIVNSINPSAGICLTGSGTPSGDGGNGGFLLMLDPTIATNALTVVGNLGTALGNAGGSLTGLLGLVIGTATTAANTFVMNLSATEKQNLYTVLQPIVTYGKAALKELKKLVGQYQAVAGSMTKDQISNINAAIKAALNSAVSVVSTASLFAQAAAGVSGTGLGTSVDDLASLLADLKAAAANLQVVPSVSTS